MAGNIAR
jgi:hypothetical protein